MERSTRCCLVGSLLAVLGACVAESDSSDLDKDVLRGGKADSSATAKMCGGLGKDRDCDICAEAGWYADGECDTFCVEPDSDCGDADGEGPQGPTCNDAEDWAIDSCLPDDDEDVDVWACVMGSHFAEQLDLRSCCEDDDFLWCEDIACDGADCGP